MSELRQVYFNGRLVGEVPKTGDDKKDLEASQELLRSKGLFQEVPKAVQMYNAAVGFLEAAAMLYASLFREPHHPKGKHMVPFAVNTAFSLELYLKAIGEATGSSPWGHDLVKVYKHLPARGRALIDGATPRLAARHVQLNGRTFLDLIREFARAFEEWRYLWDKPGQVGQFKIDEAFAVARVLHEVASELLYPGASNLNMSPNPEGELQ